MIIEGVNFVEDVVKTMKKKDFVDKHKNVFFLDKPADEREQFLIGIYNKIKGDKPATNEGAQ